MASEHHRHQSPPSPARGEPDPSRRAFVAKAAYLAPVLLTFPTRLGAAQVGSGGGTEDCTISFIPDPIEGGGIWIGYDSEGRVCFS